MNMAAVTVPLSLVTYKALIDVARAVDRQHTARADDKHGLCPTCEALRQLDAAMPLWRNVPR